MAGIGDEAALRLVNQVFDIWIRPEIQKRKEVGRDAPEERDIRRALIVFREGLEAQVRLNAEAALIGKAIAARALDAGAELTLEDVHDIVWVDPPRIEGQPACYVLVHLGPTTRIIFNFRPNWNDFKEEEWEEEGKRLAAFVAMSSVEEIIGPLEDANTLLLPYGWWVMQSGIPHPVSQALEEARKGESQEAIDQMFLEHFNEERLRTMLESWMAVDVFKIRELILREALEAYFEGKLTLPIPTLLPHLEGILTDWLRTAVREVPWGLDDKVTAMAESAVAMESGYITDQTLRFLLEVLGELGIYESFDWNDEEGVTLNRHKVTHGKLVEYWTPANNLRVILLIDALFRQFKFRS